MGIASPSSFCILFLLLVCAESQTVQIKDVERPPPKYRCVSILGVCGVTLTEGRCKQLCLNYYSGLDPFPYCATPLNGVKYCYCRHDCFRG
ncbi:hypothetical protein CDL12_00018 [Handroanthus impetiginosus]|uniref:Knottin scorpion toxin-like domain-containing protein n=1 Tax=Handroanthus impetiginosus TaxID=429701 RepID=A0A2G9IBW0_9LAMI|nr:hypothetical protein CDL12_00018 [Handroanthus impetiginosus]